jgi:hypothetical protein
MKVGVGGAILPEALTSGTKKREKSKEVQIY